MPQDVKIDSGWSSPSPCTYKQQAFVELQRPRLVRSVPAVCCCRSLELRTHLGFPAVWCPDVRGCLRLEVVEEDSRNSTPSPALLSSRPCYRLHAQLVRSVPCPPERLLLHCNSRTLDSPDLSSEDYNLRVRGSGND